MNVRLFDKSDERDWSMLQEWCEGHSFPLMPREAYPCIGFIVDDLACAWLYQSDTPLGWLEWMIINPKRRRAGMIALSAIYDEALEKARDLGMIALFSSLQNESLIKLSQAKGFEVTDEGITNMIRRL